jgi:erythrocyte band 7 integral membrane protein
LHAGSPGQRKDVADDDSGDLGYCFYILAFFSFLIVIVFFPFSLIWSVKIVKDYERAVILRLGRLVSKKAKGPGIFFVLPCIDDVRVINLRTVTFDVPPQEILTKDSVTCRVDAVVYFRISDPIKSVISVENALNSTYLRAQTTLRNILGTKNLKDILSERDIIRAEMSRMLDEATDPWGVKVERVEMKDVSLPQDMQRSMAAEAEATREANAKVISANGERSASEKLRQAADIIDESPTSLQLRYLQTLNTIAAENNHTYVFPLPVDLLMKFFGKQ